MSVPLSDPDRTGRASGAAHHPVPDAPDVPDADDVLTRNRAAAARVRTPGMPAPPARRTAVVACMDARLDPLRVLGLDVGDAHVVRNAGGIVTDDVIRSLCLSQRKLGTCEILLVHHTDCGLCGLDADAFVDELAAAVGETPTWTVGAFDDTDADVRESMRRLAASPFIAGDDAIRGFVYDVDTGLLKEVT